MEQFEAILRNTRRLHIQQIYEGFEIVLGFESRNKYRIFDEDMRPVAYAAEESTGIGGTLLRQFFGHWRKFNINIYDQNKNLLYRSYFPFRWFFKSLYLKDASGNNLGHLHQRFALFNKKFDIFDKNGRPIGRIRSPWFRLWTFEINLGFKKLAKIEKKWAGLLSEFFTDKDNYLVSFSPSADDEMRRMLLATTLMIDIVYFENNQGKGSLLGLFD